MAVAHKTFNSGLDIWLDDLMRRGAHKTFNSGLDIWLDDLMRRGALISSTEMSDPIRTASLNMSQKLEIIGHIPLSRGLSPFAFNFTSMEDKYPTMKLPYDPTKALVDDEIRGLLPDPNMVIGSVLNMFIGQPVQTNYEGNVVQAIGESGYVFEKLILRTQNDDGTISDTVTWSQRGFNPLKSVESRKEFVKEAFGLTDAELEELLKK